MNLHKNHSLPSIIKIGYVIVRENPTDPLVQSQCFDVIEAVNDSRSECVVQLIWFYRLDYLFRRNTTRLSALRKQLQAQGIKGTFVPFISLGFPLSWWQFPVVLPQWLLGLLYIRFVLGFRSLHCRSYHAGIIALIASKFVGVRYVFDPRSPFPEENVSAGRWKVSSLSYRLWKRLETNIIKGSNKTILVSSRLRDYYHEVDLAGRFRVIPNNYPAAFERNEIKAVSIAEKKYTLVYVGSFGNWNKPGPYLKLLSSLNQISLKPCNMLFIVRTAAAREIEFEAREHGVDQSLFDIVSIPQNQVVDYLAQCSFGVYLMECGDPRLGVKTVEYLSVGLPVIVSENIFGAADLINSQRLGVVWDHSDDGVQAIYEWMCTPSVHGGFSADACREVAKKFLSPSAVAHDLSEVYDEVFKK